MSDKQTMQAFGTLGSLGFAFVIAIVMGAGGGLLIDRWIGAGHWGFFIGFFPGLRAAVVPGLRGAVEDISVARRAGQAILKVAGRYALLAFLAYVMIARLRLPPLGLIAGAS